MELGLPMEFVGLEYAGWKAAGGRLTRLAVLLLLAICLVGLAGCRSIELKPSGRAASDQFLVASCIEGAMEKLEIADRIRGEKLKLNVPGIGNDREYIGAVLKSWVIQSGGVIAEDTKTSPGMILNLMVPAAGSDHEVAKWVLPIPIPVPSAQTGIAFSYIELFKVESEVGRCHLWAYATDPATKMLFRQEPVYIQHYITNREILGFTIGRTSDIRELKRNPGVLSVDAPTERLEPQAE